MTVPPPPAPRDRDARVPPPVAGRTLLAAAALGLALGLVLGGCGGDGGGGQGRGQGGAPGARPVQVEVAAARREPVVYYDRFPGTVRPLDEVEVRPQVAGYVTRVHHVEGQPVSAGQRLYTLDTRAYRAAAESAAAEVESARAELALAEKNAARYRRLAEAEAVALQTLDQAETELEAARQAVAGAEARRRRATTDLDYAVVRAPLAGITGLGSAKVGTQVAPGQPVLVTISQRDPVGVDFAAPQELIPRLGRAEAAPGEVPDSLFRLRLPDGTRYAAYGEVYARERAVDAATGTLTTRLRFPNPDGVLVPGMNLEVEVLNPASGESVTVPTTALADQMGERYVFVVADDTLALRRKVTTGITFRDRTVVSEGLDGGEAVAAAGLNRLRDSASVRPARSAGGGSRG